MFGAPYRCQHCARLVADYIGQVFAGSVLTVDVPTGSPHSCYYPRGPRPEHLGQQRECINCWQPIHVAGNGKRTDLDGSVHDCWSKG